MSVVVVVGACVLDGRDATAAVKDAGLREGEREQGRDIFTLGERQVRFTERRNDARRTYKRQKRHKKTVTIHYQICVSHKAAKDGGVTRKTRREEAKDATRTETRHRHRDA